MAKLKPRFLTKSWYKREGRKGARGFYRPKKQYVDQKNNYEKNTKFAGRPRACDENFETLQKQ